MKRKAAAAALAAGLLGGGAAGMILGSTGVSGAQETTTTVEQQAGDTAQTETDRPDPSERLRRGARTAGRGRHHHPGPGRRGDRGAGRGRPAGRAAVTAAAARWVAGAAGASTPPPRPSAITSDELRTALEDGQTIAEVAAEKGVDVQTVIDAMVAGLKAHLDEEVASGEHTQEEADQKLADATERITDSVNNGMPERGERPQD